MSTDSGTTRKGAAHDRLVLWAALVLGAVALSMRVNNALRYRTGNGFDAVENLEYVKLLLGSWALPPPDAAWATSHPPLFYYMAAGLWRCLAAVGLDAGILQAIPLAVSVAGIVTVAIAVRWVWIMAPGDSLRALLAGALLLFLPVHIYMSVMVGEELLVTLWMSLALFFALPIRSGEGPSDPALQSFGRAAGVGLFAGLAMLTKMTGVLAPAAIAATWLIAGSRRRRLGRAVGLSAFMGLVALAVGGWYYVYTLATYGYLYPQDLAVHQLMFEMPPGDRGLLDYLRIPLATFTDPQLLHPDLLVSVWGGTYDTVWFDGHRHFLGGELGGEAGLRPVGVAILLLALLPTAAFLVGLLRAARRALRDPGGLDTLLVILSVLLVAGYVGFTASNPWFATVKGSYLLGLSVPFAVYTSEVLAGWIRSSVPARRSVLGLLGALWILTASTFTLGLFFEKSDGPGLPWREVRSETAADG